VDCNLVVRNGGDDYLNFGHYPRDYSVISVNGKAAASVHPVGSKYLVYSQFTEKQHLFILDNFSGKEDDLAVGNRDTMSFSIFPNEYKK